MSEPVLVWFRQDLRIEDNSALSAAVETGRPVIPVYIHAPEEEGTWPPGGASKWWLHHALEALDKALQGYGSGLVLRSGPTLESLLDICNTHTPCERCLLEPPLRTGHHSPRCRY